MRGCPVPPPSGRQGNLVWPAPLDVVGDFTAGMGEGARVPRGREVL